MIFFNIIGWIAAIFGVVMYIPQVMKTVFTKNTRDLSKITFTIITFGTSFWTIYTADINSYQGWIANTIILFFIFPIIYLIYSKLNFAFIFIILVGILISSIFLLTTNVYLNYLFKYIFVFLASIGTASPFYFQIYKTFKNKNCSSLSMTSLIMILITNVIWAIYWIGLIILKDSTTSLIIAFMASAFSGVSQIPLIYALLKFK